MDKKSSVLVCSGGRALVNILSLVTLPALIFEYTPFYVRFRSHDNQTDSPYRPLSPVYFAFSHYFFAVCLYVEAKTSCTI